MLQEKKIVKFMLFHLADKNQNRKTWSVLLATWKATHLNQVQFLFILKFSNFRFANIHKFWYYSPLLLKLTAWKPLQPPHEILVLSIETVSIFVSYFVHCNPLTTNTLLQTPVVGTAPMYNFTSINIQEGKLFQANDR